MKKRVPFSRPSGDMTGPLIAPAANVGRQGVGCACRLCRRLIDTTATNPSHSSVPTTTAHYLVRGMRLESNSSGSYTNLSLGTLSAVE